MPEKFKVITPIYKGLLDAEIEDVLGAVTFSHASVCDCEPGGDPMDKDFAMNLYCADNWLAAMRERQTRIGALKLLLRNFANEATADMLDTISIEATPQDNPLRAKSALSGKEPTAEESIIYGKWRVGETLREQANYLRNEMPF